MVWMNQQDKTQSTVLSLKPNVKQTGWIVSCEDFDAFMWNSDKLLLKLVTALTLWVKDGNGKALVCKADSSEKRGFVIEVLPLKAKEKPPVWISTGVGFKVQTEEDLDDDSNPFL